MQGTTHTHTHTLTTEEMSNSLNLCPSSYFLSLSRGQFYTLHISGNGQHIDCVACLCNEINVKLRQILTPTFNFMWVEPSRLLRKKADVDIWSPLCLWQLSNFKRGTKLRQRVMCQHSWFVVMPWMTVFVCRGELSKDVDGESFVVEIATCYENSLY